MHIENMHVGDYLTVLDVIGVDSTPVPGMEEFLNDRDMARHQDAMRYVILRGEVLRVEAVNAPFIAVTVFMNNMPPGRTMVDTRLVELKPVSAEYAEFFKQSALQHAVGALRKEGLFVGRLLDTPAPGGMRIASPLEDETDAAV